MQAVPPSIADPSASKPHHHGVWHQPASPQLGRLSEATWHPSDQCVVPLDQLRSVVPGCGCPQQGFLLPRLSQRPKESSAGARKPSCPWQGGTGSMKRCAQAWQWPLQTGPHPALHPPPAGPVPNGTSGHIRTVTLLQGTCSIPACPPAPAVASDWPLLAAPLGTTDLSPLPSWQRTSLAPLPTWPRVQWAGLSGWEPHCPTQPSNSSTEPQPPACIAHNMETVGPAGQAHPLPFLRTHFNWGGQDSSSLGQGRLGCAWWTP